MEIEDAILRILMFDLNNFSFSNYGDIFEVSWQWRGCTCGKTLSTDLLGFKYILIVLIIVNFVSPCPSIILKGSLY